MKRAFLVGVCLKSGGVGAGEDYEGLGELRQLAGTAGYEPSGEIVFNVTRPGAAFFIGSGQAQKLASQCLSSGAGTIIFDINLKPAQQRNLENATRMRVIDRTRLILDIFAMSAHTQDGRDQVELAKCEYLLPRLAGMWTHLERQRGGTETRGGAGEKEIETDRRRIEKKISALKKKLKSLAQRRGIQRRRRIRSGIPTVALCGYTNSGKTTLLNALTKARAVARDRLFQTLQPMTRRTKIFDKDVLFVDTVGFIKNIPTQLINAFHSTLEEIEPASIVLIVLDASDVNVLAHKRVVEETLAELNYDGIPRVYAANKSDLENCMAPPGAVRISALRGAGLEDLKSRIYGELKRQYPEVKATG